MIARWEKVAAVYGYKAASSRDKSHLGRIDLRYERWRPAGRQGVSRGCDGLRRSKQGREDEYWVGIVRQLRLGAAARRESTAAVVARVRRSLGAWCVVFRRVS
jgi:hypothetical protein